ncbi:hypothetical protein MFLAVUS_009044 [Mucor flavus]|uniref:Uncharacterized protein n=1 Tax=Mucor flavus TaxID=439312 RepID=A0ABP9Z8Y6_9FUNG
MLILSLTSYALQTKNNDSEINYISIVKVYKYLNLRKIRLRFRSYGVINLSVRVPKAPPKIRKIQGGKKRKVPEDISRKDEPKGTTTGHYLKFINDTLDIMDKYKNLRLNPIEQFWALVKARTKRQKLQDTETLEARITEAAYDIPTNHLQNIVLHSKNHFINCLNKVPI